MYIHIIIYAVCRATPPQKNLKYNSDQSAAILFGNYTSYHVISELPIEFSTAHWGHDSVCLPNGTEWAPGREFHDS